MSWPFLIGELLLQILWLIFPTPFPALWYLFEVRWPELTSAFQVWSHHRFVKWYCRFYFQSHSNMEFTFPPLGQHLHQAVIHCDPNGQFLVSYRHFKPHGHRCEIWGLFVYPLCIALDLFTLNCICHSTAYPLSLERAFWSSWRSFCFDHCEWFGNSGKCGYPSANP